MSDIQTWSTTAGNNNSSPPNGWPENMQYSQVNDAAREMMAAMAKWYADTNGSLSSGGSANAYTLAPNRTISAYADGLSFTFKANHTNTAAATFNVSSLGATAIKNSDDAALTAGSIVSGSVYTVVYSGSVFRLIGVRSEAFAAGTKMLFQQTSAPTGWTKDSTHNDKALRVVSGAASSGGSSPFSTVFGKTATNSHTLTEGQIPPHAHTVTRASASGAGSTAIDGGGDLGQQATSSTGGGGGHSHNMDIRVQYVDTIIATKD